MYIRINVIPGAKEEFVKKYKNDSYAISVSLPAERGLANERAIQLLRQSLGNPKGAIRIVSGHHSPHKIVSIDTEMVK